jgi:hypothetical protein
MINKSNQFYRNAVCAMAQALDANDDYATYKNLHSRSVALMDVYVNQTGMMRITVMASIVGDVMAMRKAEHGEKNRDARIYGLHFYGPDWEARA